MLVPGPSAVAGVSNLGDAAVAWPTAWNQGRYATGTPISDVNGDQTPTMLDIGSGPCTGSCTGPDTSVYYASDGTTAFFRLRLSTDITDPGKGGLVGGAFLTQIALASTDAVVAVVGVDGKHSSADYVYVATAPGTSVVPVYTYPFDTSGGQNSAGMRVVPDGNGQFFLDYQVPFARLQAAAVASGASSFSASTPVKLYFGTSAAANLATINKDFMSGNVTAADFSALAPVTFNPSAAALTANTTHVSGPNPPAAGATTRFTATLTAQNTGGGELSGSTVTATLPAGTSYVAGSTANGTVSATGSTVTWNAGTLLPLSSRTATVTVDLTPSQTAVGSTVGLLSSIALSATDAGFAATRTASAPNLTAGPVAQGNRAPTASPVTATAQENGSVTVDASPYVSDPDGHVLTYAVGSVPAHGTVTVSGSSYLYTPTAGYVGPDSFSYTVCDPSNACATGTVTVSVRTPPAVAFSAPPVGAVGNPYEGRFSVSGGTGPYSWSVSAGELPAGLMLDAATGLLSGTPTAVGTSMFTVRVTDADARSDDHQVTFDVRMPPTAELTSSAPDVTFGNEVSLTAGVAGADASGTVTFTGVPATGPDAGSPVTLGSVPLVDGVATLPFTPTSFGLHTITAAYSGDATWAAATSPPVTVEVSAYRGELIVSEFRTSGPNGPSDGYIELYNTGAPIPLAGFRITSGSGTTTTLPADAATLGTGRSYLVAGSQSSLSTSSLGGLSHPDLIAPIGSDGFEVTAPDTAGTRTDAAGPGTGPHLGTGLPAMVGSPTDNHAWVRTPRAGAPRDTANNTADFTLVSTTGGTVGGVPAALGSPAPTGTGDVHQHNATLTSTLLDPLAGAAAAPNRVKAGTTLTVRRTITNTSNAAVTDVQVRLTSLSQTNGAPYPGPTPPVKPADLTLTAPATPTSSVATTGGTKTVINLAPDTPTGPDGGGLNTTLTVPLPETGLPAGASIDISLTFTIINNGTFWLGYDVESR